MGRHSVVVVGAGNAALCAAISAREAGAEVTVLERAPARDAGGNSYFTGGLMRFAHDGFADLSGALPELAGGGAESVDVAAYTSDDFFDDMATTTSYRADGDLVEFLVRASRPTVDWLHEQGLRFTWSLGRHAYNVRGRFRFWGGAALEVSGAGAGLVDTLTKRAEDLGCRFVFECRAAELLTDAQGAVTGVGAWSGGERQSFLASAVVLACGGFEANPTMRAQYLGPNWDLARVRGTGFNSGDGLQMALRAHALPYGHWSGCHAVAWDANSPLIGDRSLGDTFSRHSYPLGIVVNRHSERFLDEGADFQTHTYAKYGAEILNQPDLTAFQIFDSKTESMLRDGYKMRQASKVAAGTISALAEKLGLSPRALLATIDAYNAAIVDVPYDPNIKDGRSTREVAPAKSNWALELDEPPFYGFPVTVGITFTFGGLRVDKDGAVQDVDGRSIRGLFAAGEIVGGLFYHNYPSGTGLTSGAVFGRVAGRAAAEHESQACCTESFKNVNRERDVEDEAGKP